MVRVGKVLLVIVLLLTLLAQAGAAVPTACDMTHSAHSDTPATTQRKHTTHHVDAGHNHGAHEAADPVDVEDTCCQPDGACSMGSCAVYNALPNTVAVSVLQLLPAENEFPNLSFASVALASLYRPPISH